MQRTALAFALGLVVHSAEATQADQSPPAAAPASAAASAAAPAFAACVRHREGQSRPPFPAAAQSAGIFGRVLARLHFEAADQPPQVELVHRPRAEPLAEAVHAWALGLRMPCHTGGRITVKHEYRFRYGGEHPDFRPFRLPELLALAQRPEDRQSFVTAGMRCPLRISWTYYQPQMPNVVKIAGDPDPAHAPVVERLARLDLALSPVASDIAWGSTARFEIPCHPPASANKE
jgi:hypothetical protein